MYKDVITIFNRRKSRDGSTWYPNVLHNVHLLVDKSAIIAKYGANSEDNAALNVRYQITDEKIMIGGKKWKPPIAWGQLPDDEKPNAITFTSGQNFDFFWFGEWTGESVISDDDYSPEGFYSHMSRTQDYVFAITSVGGPYSVIPHFEIMGR